MESDGSFLQSLSIQWRVIRALLMREIITRYGRHNIGFFWLFFEPLMFCSGVTVLWIKFHHESKHLPVAEFAITGYSMILLWRNCAGRCSQCITPNLSLLYHHNVRVIDVLAARIILEIAGCAMAFSLLVTVFTAAGFIKPPYDIGLMLEGYLMMAWFAAALGITICAFSELSDVFDRVWHPLAYFMLPISGLTYMVDWFPIRIQKMALLVPMVNGTEMFRDGYFGPAVHCHYSVPYLACWCAGLMLVGLTFLKIFERRVEPQ